MNIERFIDKDNARRIKTEIRSVLMQEWDPIGVKDEPAAAGEYDSYIGGIYELLKNGAAAKEISEYLREIEIKRMGFAEFQVPQHLSVATSLMRIELDRDTKRWGTLQPCQLEPQTTWALAPEASITNA